MGGEEVKGGVLEIDCQVGETEFEVAVGAQVPPYLSYEFIVHS